MANEQNLKPVRTKSEARERGRNGGIKSGESRRQKRTLREIMEAYGIGQSRPDSGLTHDEAVVVAQYTLAEDPNAKGSTQAAAFIRDTKGEKPHDILETPDIEIKPLVDLTKRKKNGE